MSIIEVSSIKIISALIWFSAFLKKYKSNSLLSDLYWNSNNLWIVVDVIAVISCILFAALPVGAARVIFFDLFNIYFVIILSKVVLPVPGPPVIIEIGLLIQLHIALIWNSSVISFSSLTIDSISLIKLSISLKSIILFDFSIISSAIVFSAKYTVLSATIFLCFKYIILISSSISFKIFSFKSTLKPRTFEVSFKKTGNSRQVFPWFKEFLSDIYIAPWILIESSNLTPNSFAILSMSGNLIPKSQYISSYGLFFIISTALSIKIFSICIHLLVSIPYFDKNKYSSWNFSLETRTLEYSLAFFLLIPFISDNSSGLFLIISIVSIPNFNVIFFANAFPIPLNNPLTKNLSIESVDLYSDFE